MEIRLNSLEEARSVVQHSPSIAQVFRESGLDGIEFIIAEELASDIRAIVAGVFNVKVWYKTIAPRPGNTLYVLPPFEPLTIPVKAVAA